MKTWWPVVLLAVLALLLWTNRGPDEWDILTACFEESMAVMDAGAGVDEAVAQEVACLKERSYPIEDEERLIQHRTSLYEDSRRRGRELSERLDRMWECIERTGEYGDECRRIITEDE